MFKWFLIEELMQKLFLLIFLSAFLGCSSSQNSIETLKKTAHEKFGENYYLSFNANKTFVICTDKKPVKPYSSFSFFIYELENNSILLIESVRNGSAYWLDESKVKVKWVLGIDISNKWKKNPTEYVYDISTKKKYYSGEQKLRN